MKTRSFSQNNLWRRATLCALLVCAQVFSGAAQTPSAQTPQAQTPKPKTPPVPTWTAEEYGARLDKIQAGLQKLLQRKAARIPLADFKKATQAMPMEVRVKRRDGATQTTEAHFWLRRLDGTEQRVSRWDVQQSLQDIETLKKSLNQWANPGSEAFYEPADAKRIVQQLEGSGQIRTGPTASQKWWGDTSKRIGDWWRRFMKSIEGWFSSNAPATPTKAPNIDTRWITFFFYSCVLSLLAIIGWMVWRSLGGKFGRSSARREVRYLQGEDAELLLLPPDELLARAHRFAQQGEFREALRHRFLSLLMRLDSMGVWRYDTRRTNWEHISALKRDTKHASLVPDISDLTRDFDRVRYGNAVCSDAQWQQFDHLAAQTEERASTPKTVASVSTQVAGGAQ